MTRNGTESAKKAGYSARSAHVQASRLLKDDKVLARIEEGLKGLQLSETDIYLELGRIGKDKSEKTADRLKAIELMGKALGIFRDQNVTVNLLQNITTEAQDKARNLLRRRGLQRPPAAAG